MQKELVNLVEKQEETTVKIEQSFYCLQYIINYFSKNHNLKTNKNNSDFLQASALIEIISLYLFETLEQQQQINSMTYNLINKQKDYY